MYSCNYQTYYLTHRYFYWRTHCLILSEVTTEKVTDSVFRPRAASRDACAAGVDTPHRGICAQAEWVRIQMYPLTPRVIFLIRFFEILFCFTQNSEKIQASFIFHEGKSWLPLVLFHERSTFPLPPFMQLFQKYLASSVPKVGAQPPHRGWGPTF